MSGERNLNGEARSVESEDRIKRLARDLEKSLERAIERSPQVEECLDRIKAEGYDVALVLDATLAFAPSGQMDGGAVDRLAGGSEGVSFRMSPLDKKFLRSLKIAVDEESAS